MTAANRDGSSQDILDQDRLREAWGESLSGQDSQQQADQVDFKMVTFSLAGKDYAIDIMKVKEIAKYDSFTFVPNTPPFVTGVYNLRGDIISVIDLRVLFNLSTTGETGRRSASGLILRLETGLIGVVVDGIDKVIGIDSETIQPPHPLFADVNLKYLSGIVEYEEKLYIILDVERVLGDEEEVAATGLLAAAAATPTMMPSSANETTESSEPQPNVQGSRGQPELSKPDVASFIAQTVEALRGFCLSDVNRQWLEARAAEWSSGRGADAQLRTSDEADDFLATFYSQYVGVFWGEEYLAEWRAALPSEWHGPLNVWNPGCRQGHETYSLACLLRSLYPEALVKIWASDKDLLNVSTAPNLTFAKNSLPESYRQFVVEGANGHAFASEIKDAILFEYSDISNSNAVPSCDIVLARDVVSFLSVGEQSRVLSAMIEKTKEGGMIVCGANERLEGLGLQDISQRTLRAYRRS